MLFNDKNRTTDKGEGGAGREDARAVVRKRVREGGIEGWRE